MRDRERDREIERQRDRETERESGELHFPKRKFFIQNKRITVEPLSTSTSVQRLPSINGQLSLVVSVL